MLRYIFPFIPIILFIIGDLLDKNYDFDDRLKNIFGAALALMAFVWILAYWQYIGLTVLFGGAILTTGYIAYNSYQEKGFDGIVTLIAISGVVLFFILVDDTGVLGFIAIMALAFGGFMKLTQD